MNTRLLFVHALSPLHAGTGQSIGAVDLPIARDCATKHPFLPGSSLKGCLRDAAGNTGGWVTDAFGPDTVNASDHAGMIAFGDANILLLPVRSIYGTFAWVTSPLVLARYVRDAQAAAVGKLPAVPTNPAKREECFTPSGSQVQQSKKVIFEDLDFDAVATAEQTTLAWAQHLGQQIFPAETDAAWRQMLVARFCIVHDDVFTHLTLHATDVVTRVALDHETKTVKAGQLWTEESLPVESVLVSLLYGRNVQKKAGDKSITPSKAFEHLAEVGQKHIQFGGKATVGRGRCRVVLRGG